MLAAHRVGGYALAGTVWTVPYPMIKAPASPEDGEGFLVEFNTARADVPLFHRPQHDGTCHECEDDGDHDPTHPSLHSPPSSVSIHSGISPIMSH